MTIQEFTGVLLIIAGLVSIGLQQLLQIGWIRPRQEPDTTPGLETPMPAETIKLMQKLLEKAGWMPVVGLVLVYFGVRCLGVSLFG